MVWANKWFLSGVPVDLVSWAWPFLEVPLPKGWNPLESDTLSVLVDHDGLGITAVPHSEPLTGVEIYEPPPIVSMDRRHRWPFQNCLFNKRFGGFLGTFLRRPFSLMAHSYSFNSLLRNFLFSVSIKCTFISFDWLSEGSLAICLYSLIHPECQEWRIGFRVYSLSGGPVSFQ